MSRTNKEVAELVSQEVWGKGNVNWIDDLYAEDYVDLNPVPGIPANREGVKMQVNMFYQAFPDINIKSEEYVVDGDRVVVRFTVQGTHEGDLMGIPPTGKTAVFTGFTRLHIVDGKVVDEYSLTDMATLFQQLGLAPAMS